MPGRSPNQAEQTRPIISYPLKKHRYTSWHIGAFYMNIQNEGVMVSLSAFSTLMACTGEKFLVFMLAHLLSSFLNNASQLITSNLFLLELAGLHDYMIGHRLSTTISISSSNAWMVFHGE
jgi:hypothetical protein